MASLNDLPTEVKLQILSYINANEIGRCRQISKNFNNIISNFPFNLQRVRCSVEVICGTGSDEKIIIKIRKSGNSKIFETNDEENNLEIIKSIEISSLRVNNKKICEDEKENKTNYFNDKAMEKLIQILIESKQKTMRIVTVQGLNLENEKVAHEFFNLISNENLQELNLNNSISNYLTPKHIEKMQSLCQIRLGNGSHQITADAIINKFGYDLRHKPKLNVPFIAEINIADPQAIFSFIQEWIYIPETPFFQIKFSNFTNEWLENFNDICEQNQIRHIFYEFNSKVNPHAHIKIKYHEESNECMIFPIKDVPARNNFANQYICYARYCRDF